MPHGLDVNTNALDINVVSFSFRLRVAVSFAIDVCSCGRLGCRLMLENGQCASDVAEEVADGRVLSWDEVATLLGLNSRQAAEACFERAMMSFVRVARKQGYGDLIERFAPRRAGLCDPSR